MTLAHVRWIAGGTGTGKSTLTRILAQRFDVAVYIGDPAEHDWAPRITRERHPHVWAGRRLTMAQRVTRTPEEIFNGMASLHGETIGFVVEDLLSWPEQAVFLLPTSDFRRTALTTRYADPDRASAAWGDTDHERALANRLARDELWDAELRRQATELDLPMLTVDGTRSAAELADDPARRFRL